MSLNNGNHKIEVELQPATLPEVELRLHAARLYVDEKRGVAEIATLLGLSRMRVYNLLNALSLSPRMMLDLQLNDVLENSVNTLAALSERMRDDATTRGGDTKERETDAKVYATLFDRTMPLMDSYMKHRPAFLKPVGPLLPGESHPEEPLTSASSAKGRASTSPESALPQTPHPRGESDPSSLRSKPGQASYPSDQESDHQALPADQES